MNNVNLFMEPDGSKIRLSPTVVLTANHPLERLAFNIPAALIEKNTQVFLLLKDAHGVREVIELVATGTLKDARKHIIYQIPVIESVRAGSGRAEMSIMILKENNTAIVTQEVSLRIAVENYKFAHQLAVMKTLNTSVVTYYEKIVQLLMKLEEKGESNYDS